MRRWIGGLLTAGLLAVVVVSLTPTSGIRAQDANEDDQATAIADLQTRVAALETAVAGTPGAETGGKVLFEANAQTGFDEWTEGYFGGFTSQFTVKDGILVADVGGYTILYAPYLTTTPDYVLEAEIRQIPTSPGTPEPAFGTIAGLAARYKDNDYPKDNVGYVATTWGTGVELKGEDGSLLASSEKLIGADKVDPREGWHTYRLEVHGDSLRFLIDGTPVAKGTGATSTGIGEDGRVGVIASLGPLEVRSFRVLAWE
jgi:hypothetical protein